MLLNNGDNGKYASLSESEETNASFEFSGEEFHLEV